MEMTTIKGEDQQEVDGTMTKKDTHKLQLPNFTHLA